MLTTKQPVFRKFWHAVMPLAHLADGPKPFTLLGEDIVLFLDEHGQPAALKDRCCHRTAKLSKGWCTDGKLQCGYHGWTYDRSGRVVRIPQYDADRPIPDGYCTPAYPCTARYGYAWVALEEPIADIPAGFVHRATFGVAAQPKPSKYELVENDTGFYAETIIPATNPEAFRRISGVSDPVTTRHMRNAYFLPFSRRLDIEYPSGIRHVIINCFTPIDDARIQLCQWLYRNDTEADCPADLLIHFDEVITREDKDILESTDPDAVIDPRRRGVEYSMDSDRPGMLIRKKLFELLQHHGESEVHRGSLPPVVPLRPAA